MTERNPPPQDPAVTDRPPRKKYSTPRLEEYGHVAKLTQSGGTTMSEAGVPAMMTGGCL